MIPPCLCHSTNAWCYSQENGLPHFGVIPPEAPVCVTSTSSVTGWPALGPGTEPGQVKTDLYVRLPLQIKNQGRLEGQLLGPTDLEWEGCIEITENG